MLLEPYYPRLHVSSSSSSSSRRAPEAIAAGTKPVEMVERGVVENEEGRKAGYCNFLLQLLQFCQQHEPRMEE